MDCAHGAASAVAGELYSRAGAEVDGGRRRAGRREHQRRRRLHPHRRAGRGWCCEHGADLGIAHDGDADRCLAVDADGAVVDGDQILAICALALQGPRRLAEDTVVATVMSNLGFHHAMRAAGITVLTTAVGDRYVLEALTEHGLSLGGEQSGHVIFTDAATTGDGLLTALRLMSCMAAAGRPLAELAAVVHRLPQVMVNVRVADRDAVAASADVPGRGRRRPTRRTRRATAGSCCGPPAPSSWSG